MMTEQTKTATLNKEQLLDTQTKKILFDCVLSGMTVKQAAKEAKISYGHARRVVTKGYINQLVLSETKVKTEDLREEAVQTLVKIMRNPETKPATAIKTVDVLGKMSGWHSNTMVLETTGRQKELNEADRQEAQQLAVLRFNPKYALPPVESEIVPLSESGATVEAAGEAIEPIIGEQNGEL